MGNGRIRKSHLWNPKPTIAWPGKKPVESSVLHSFLQNVWRYSSVLFTSTSPMWLIRYIVLFHANFTALENLPDINFSNAPGTLHMKTCSNKFLIKSIRFYRFTVTWKRIRVFIAISRYILTQIILFFLMLVSV